MLKQQLKQVLALSVLSLSNSQTVFALEPGAAPQAPAGNTMGIPLSAPLPPGLYYTISNKMLNGQLKDENGDNMGLKLDAPASTSIFIYTPGWKVLGGDYRAWLAVPLILAEEEITNPMLGKLGKHSNTNIANIDVHFADISWTLAPGKFLSAGVGAIATTGSWKLGGTNTSGEYWSINPRVGYSLMNQDWNMSFESHYFYNFENDKTKYDSGDEFFFDATVLKKLDSIHQGLQIGPIGYVREQVTSDENNGTAYYGHENGKARQMGLGVQLLKDFGRGLFVGLSWSKDLETKNAVSNDGRIALNISVPMFMKNKPQPAHLPADF
ncbi:transporter [Acinetobacter sp. FL51]|uniref:SphA family protein n=1 Tax=Acinetobacter sp. FL51 TaxID=2777978 RepID=UPI0018E17E6D|nr:transporter [Acinetobacter sp. FL51]MBI1453358.1 transporter [Acinetobacter sp. FL51]